MEQFSSGNEDGCELSLCLASHNPIADNLQKSNVSVSCTTEISDAISSNSSHEFPGINLDLSIAWPSFNQISFLFSFILVFHKFFVYLYCLRVWCDQEPMSSKLRTQCSKYTSTSYKSNEEMLLRLHNISKLTL